MAKAETPVAAGEGTMRESSAGLAERYGAAYPWLVAITTLSAFATAVLTSSIVNVAVPDVMGAFGVGQDRVQFIATAFFATMTASLLLSPWAVARFGPRLTFSVSLAFFTLGALMCTFSASLPAIIVGRVVQGFASGILQPLVMVSLVQAFPPERRGLAMGLFSMGIVCAHGVGPYFGGLTIDHFNWRLIFLVPLPVVFFAFAMGLIFLPRRASGSAGPRILFDFRGFGLLCIALFSVMTAIANGQRDGWVSDGILMLLLIAVISGGGFVASQLRRGAGMLDLTLFRNIPFSAAICVAFVYGLSNFAGVYLYPVFGQLVQDYTPTAAGFLILPGTLFAALILPLTGRFADIAPPQFGIALGVSLFAASNLVLAGADISTMFPVVAFLIFVGRVGLAFMTPAMTSAALGALPPEKLSQGAAIVNFTMLGGGALGINGLVVILDRRTQFHGDALTATQTSANPATRELLASVARLLGEEGFAEALRPSVALNYLGEVLHAQANTFGFQDGFTAIAIVAMLGLAPAAVLHLNARTGKRPHTQ
ncbi:MAG: DHA2 family efflux MFS transporter permease subunit [Rickettsiales bacterium]